MSSAKYRRLLLKVSGEMLAGEQGYGIQPSILEGLAAEIASVVALDIEDLEDDGQRGREVQAARERLADLHERAQLANLARRVVALVVVERLGAARARNNFVAHGTL